MRLKEKVSIIVRTCGRPEVLRVALESIRKQTYKNIEVIIVEDGQPVSRSMICENYADLDITYYATEDRVGRSKVGNLGLALAKGEYFNFLDDDDILYPKHIEKLLQCIHERNVDAAYSVAEESQIKVISKEPYVVKEKRIIVRYRQTYNKMLLFSFNYIPIQSIMFKRTMFDNLGGFDEKLDYLEDWDLWVRYSTKYNFVFLDDITSKYFVPYRSKKKMERNRELEKALNSVRDKFSQYQVTLNVKQLNSDMDYVLNVYNKKGLLHYLKMIRNYIIYRDI